MELECTICFEMLINEAVAAFCGHVFCECVKKIIESTKKCPICSRPLAVNQLFTVFLKAKSPIVFGRAAANTKDEIHLAGTASLSHELENIQKIYQESVIEIEESVVSVERSISRINSTQDDLQADMAQLKNDVTELKEKLKDLEFDKENDDVINITDG